MHRRYKRGLNTQRLAVCGESTNHATIVLFPWGEGSDDSQKPLWVAAADLPQTAAHPFYRRLNELLEEHGFDAFAKQCCEKFCAERMGRPSLAPGVYLRGLLIGYFDGLDSERLIAWRLADSISLRRFVAIELDESMPDHSTISRTRGLIDVETQREVFTRVLQVIAQEGMLKGGTIAVDATTPIVPPASKPSRASSRSAQVNTARCVSMSDKPPPARDRRVIRRLLAELDRQKAPQRE